MSKLIVCILTLFAILEARTGYFEDNVVNTRGVVQFNRKVEMRGSRDSTSGNVTSDSTKTLYYDTTNVRGKYSFSSIESGDWWVFVDSVVYKRFVLYLDGDTALYADSALVADSAKGIIGGIAASGGSTFVTISYDTSKVLNNANQVFPGKTLFEDQITVTGGNAQFSGTSDLFFVNGANLNLDDASTLAGGGLNTHITFMQSIQVETTKTRAGSLVVRGELYCDSNITADTLFGYGGALTGVSATKADKIEHLYAGSFNYTLTNFAPLTRDTATAGRMQFMQLFDDSTPESLVFNLTVPETVLSTDSIHFNVSATAITAAASKGTVWKIGEYEYGSGEVWTGALVVDTLGTLSMTNTQDAVDILRAGRTYGDLGWTSKDNVDLRVWRNTGSTADDLSGDVGLTKLIVEMSQQ